MLVTVLKTELFAYRVLFKQLYSHAFDRKLRTKCSLMQFLRNFVSVFHEALTDDGASIDDVAKDTLAGNLHALSGKVAIVTGASRCCKVPMHDQHDGAASLPLPLTSLGSLSVAASASKLHVCCSNMGVMSFGLCAM